MAEPTVQDLSGDALLKRAKREILAGVSCPVIGGVALRSKIGEGVTGSVYIGQHLDSQREVAVKIMPYSDDTSERFLRFMAHAKSARNVKSPRVIEVFDAGEDAGVFYQVMEYLPCLSAEQHLSSLKERLKTGMTESSLLDLAVAAGEGLAATHGAGLLHLDIRPSCFLIPRTGVDVLEFAEAKLGDVGQAFNEFVAHLLSATPAETGMPGFMSPEQARGHARIDKASDVFSMGAALYALLAGQPPFGGFSVDALLQATTQNEIVDIRTWRPDLSRATAKIMEICLRKEAALRFADAAALTQALQISRAAMNGTSDIQDIAIKEIESLASPSQSTESPSDQTTLLSQADRAQLARSSGTTPLPPPPDDSGKGYEPTVMAVSAAEIQQAAARSAAASGAGFEATQMGIPASSWNLTQSPDKTPAPNAEENHGNAAEMFADMLKKKPEPPPPSEPADLEATMVYGAMPVPLPAAPVSTTAPEVKSAAATNTGKPNAPREGVVPLIPAARQNSGASGLLVAALLAAACGLGAWKLGLFGGDAKRSNVVVQSALSAAPAEDLAAKAALERAATEAKAKEAADAKIKAEQEAKAKADADRTAEVARLRALEEDTKHFAEAKAKTDAEALAKANALKLKVDAEIKAQLEFDARKTEQERLVAEALRIQEKADALRLAELKAKAGAEAKAKYDAEAPARARAKKLQEEADKIADQKAYLESEAKAKAEAAVRPTSQTARIAARSEDEKRAAEAAKAAADARETKSKPAVAAADLKKEAVIELGVDVKLDFSLVPAGSFVMGTDAAALSDVARVFAVSEQDFADELPARRVALNAFYISKTAVTVAQFRRFTTATGFLTTAEKVGAAYTLQNRNWQSTPGANWAQPGFKQTDDHPAVLLSWRDCDAYARWLAKESGQNVRLPSEAEWEYAARGPEGRLFPWGSNWESKAANHADKRLESVCLPDWNYAKADDGFAYTSPVGKFKNASWCGALDMAGNVFQWCADVYEPYPKPGAKAPPQLILEETDIPPDAKRVLRGGSFLYMPAGCRSAARRSSSPRSASVEFGMRLVMSAE